MAGSKGVMPLAERRLGVAQRTVASLRTPDMGPTSCVGLIGPVPRKVPLTSDK